MNEFKTMIIRLKETIKEQLKTDRKVLDKDIATVLAIKPSTLASYKKRNKPPYKAILTYCHQNRLDVRKVLFSEDKLVISYPISSPVKDGKVRVKYFSSLVAYSHFLKLYKEVQET